MPNISLNGVTVAYPVVISGRQQSAFAAATQAMSFGRFGRDNHGVDHVVALNNLNLSIKEGSRLGIIGRNGSGKSTLLKTLAGIITPRKGVRVVNGSIGCVLNIGAGLEFEKTGYENMRMIARLYGLNGAALRNAVDEAADFTELGPFLSMPVRTYSSGMMARLCFAMATAQHAEIMLIDEVIGTGDSHFIDKAVARIKTLCANSGIVVVATHARGILDGFCDEAIMMESGAVRLRGSIDEVWELYSS